MVTRRTAETGKRYDLPVILIPGVHDKLAMHLKRQLRALAVHGFPAACNRPDGLAAGLQIGVGGFTYPRASKTAMSSQNYRWHRCCRNRRAGWLLNGFRAA